MGQRFEKASKIFQSMFSLRNDMASYEEIENTIVSGAKFQGTNAWILILAILVASIGLNMNSTAVIIGAMLISPLMGGITAIAYGFATNNLGLAKWSAFRLGIQFAVSIVTSCIYFLLSPMNTASSELLARTSPTIWDVLIAICGGLAGIIGQTRKEKSNVIPGVAIATALMPPLCTAGYGLAHLEFSYFFGALYLFFINGFFICVTAIAVLKYLRVPQFKELSQKALTKIHRTIVIVAIITMIPSIVLAYNIVAESIESSNADNYIKKEFVFDDTQIVQKSVDIDKNTIDISLIGKEISADTLSELENKLDEYNLSGYTLNVNQTKLNSGITEDEVKEMLAEYEMSEEQPNVDEILAQRENEELKTENERLQQDIADLQDKINSAADAKIDVKQLSSELTALNGKIKGAAASYTDVYITDKNTTHYNIIVTLLVSENLKQSELDTIKNWLVQRLDNEAIVLFQQNASVYTGDDSSEVKDDKEEKADESDSSAEKSDSSKADG